MNNKNQKIVSSILMIFSFIGLMFLSTKCSSQTYISIAPQLTNTAGSISEKTNMAIEVGKQWDVFSMGLAFGKTTFSKMSGKDTSTYLEIRPNLNIFQQGKFTNTFTAGVGYVFHGKENLLTELTSGIEYSASEQFHINAVFGQYFYSGLESASNVTFFGVSFVWFLKPGKLGSIIKPKKIYHDEKFDTNPELLKF